MWVADWPGLGKKGDKVTCYGEYKIEADGKALVGTFYGGNGTGRYLCVFDAGSKTIRSILVSSGGSVWTSVLFKRNGKWVDTATGSNPDGSKLQSDSTLTISDNGKTHTWDGSGTIGGKKTDDQHDVWRRVGM